MCFSAPMYLLVLINFLSTIMANAFPSLNDEEQEMEAITTETTPTTILKGLHPRKNDRTLLEKTYNLLLETKTGGLEVNRQTDGFIYCFLIVQSAKSSSDKCRFRVKISWTGMDVKKEVEKLYEIPTHYQTLIINGKVVSDAQTLEAFEVKPTGQIIYVVLTKKKLRNAGPRIKISDFVAPQPDQPMDTLGAIGGMDVETDGSSDVGETSADAAQTRSATSTPNRNKNKRKKRGKKR